MSISQVSLLIILTTFITLTSGEVSAAKFEKCAGILKDRDKNTWITLPKGTCEKLVGGKLVAGGGGRKSSMKNSPPISQELVAKDTSLKEPAIISVSKFLNN